MPTTPSDDRLSASPKKDERSTFLMLIAALKRLKGLLLISVGIGALRLVHRDIRAIITEWIEVLHLNPDAASSTS